MSKPTFGQLVVNTWASPANPQREGMFVRSYRRTGRVNKGVWWELTDGKGAFWSVPPDACVVRDGASMLSSAKPMAETPSIS